LELYLKNNYPEIKIKTDDDKNSKKWDRLNFFYKNDKKPIVVKLDINDGSENLVTKECKEFIDEIGNPGLSFAKRKIIKHLKNVKYIICSQILNDADDDSYNLNGELLNYFVNNYEGLIQADGEGFYNGYKLIVKLD